MFEDLLINVRVNQDGVRDGINGVNNSLRGLRNSLSGLNQIIGGAKLYVLADGLAKCIKSTMEMTETVNLFNVAMGDTAVVTDNTISKLSEVSGLDLTNFQNAVGTFSLLARSMGMTTKQASILSINTSQLAIDLSSLTNVPIARVMQDLRSGLLGQSETVYKYGMDVTEAGLKTEAMRQGISKSVRDMSQGEKMALRYSVMIRQSGLAQGDFARTIETPANQLRILSERFITLGRSIGAVFMPLIGAVLPYLNALVSMLTNVMNAIAKFFGFKPPEVANTSKTAIGGMDDVGDSADKTTGKVKKTNKALKDMKNSLMGFDEINILPKEQPNKDGAGKNGSGGGADILADFKMPSYDSLMKGIHQKSDDIKKAFEDAFSKLNFNVLKASFENLWFEVKPVIDNIGTSVKWLWDNILVPFGKFTIGKALPAFLDLLSASFRALDPLMDSVGSGLKWMWDFIFKPMAKFVGKLFIDFLVELRDELIVIGNWIKDHKPFIEGLTLNLGSFAIAWGVVTTALKLWNIIGALSTVVTGGLATAMAILTSPITMVVLAIGTLIAIGILLYRNWDEIKAYSSTVWNSVVAYIKGAFNGIGDWFKGIWNGITNVFGNVTSFMKTNMSGTYSSLTSIISGIKTIFSGLTTFISGVFTGNWKKAFDGLKTIVKGIFDSMTGIFKVPLNFLIDGINTLIRGLNKLASINLPVVGKMGFTIPTIPRLARGGMVGGGGLFQAGENGKAEMIGSYQGKTTVMPLENTSFVSAMSDAVYGAVKSAIGTSSGSGGNSGDLVLQIGSTEFGRIAIDSINKITKQEGKLSLNI